MGCPYQGSDINALAYLCLAFELPAPGNGSTLNEILAAVAAAAVELEYQGSDRNFIDALWDVLDAVPALTYAWDATPEEITAFGAHYFAPLMSPGNLSGIATLHGSLGEGVSGYTFFAPTGFATETNNFLDTGEAGTISFALVHPTGVVGLEGETHAYATTLSIGPQMAPLVSVTVLCAVDGTFITSVVAPGFVDNVLTDQATPPELVVVTFTGTTLTVTIDDVDYVTDAAYTAGPVLVGAFVNEQQGVVLDGSDEITVTLAFTLPVLAP